METHQTLLERQGGRRAESAVPVDNHAFRPLRREIKTIRPGGITCLCAESRPERWRIPMERVVDDA